MFKKAVLAASVLLSLSAGASAQSTLLFLEAEAVAGYSSSLKKPVYYSYNQRETMQKPSLGFDYIARFSGKTKDFGVLAVQVRFAYNQSGGKTVEPQIYNAYFKYKAGFADIWIGHNRPAFGLTSYFNNHADLMPTLSMTGYGYDRDWGVGLNRDLPWGDVAVSITTGSGMPLYFRGNYLASARISRGVLNRDNVTVGLSAAMGKALDSMGYYLMSQDPIKRSWASLDLAYLWRNLENRIEVAVGRKMDRNTFAVSWRLGMNLLGENRLKLEIQPVFQARNASSAFQYFAGVSYQMNFDLALRTLYQYVPSTRDHRIVVQFYFYKGL
jgi:hypothetical protein